MAISVAERDVIEQTRNYKVTKSNALIQKSRFTLSLQEQKIIAYLTAQIEPKDEEFKTYTFEIKKFCDICGIQADGMYKNLKEVTQKLSDKSFWCQTTADEVTLLRWISSVSYQKAKGTITIRIDDVMKPFLLELKKQFTTYQLANILAFKSQYSLRLYEILKSYANLYTWTVSVEELKKLLDAERYVNFKDFRNRVLEPAEREINQFADIEFTYETIAKGKRIDKISFFIKPAKDSIQRAINLGEVLDK